jgi:glyoxylase-like metal-dependent hydrolase (beta-lactamase superfamily II)
MRAVALTGDLIVFVSRVWQTSATAVRAGGEALLIDSPVYPDELAALHGVLTRARFPLRGLLATHADWDHLLGRLAFPRASLGVGEPSAQRLRSHPGQPQRELRAFDQEHYVEREAPLSLAGMQPLPVPGKLALGQQRQAQLEIELHPAPGHTADGTAFWVAEPAALVCGDYLSPVEIPMICAGGCAREYLETLERLAAIVDRARHVIPGHGAPLQRARAQRLAAEDRAYLQQLMRSGDAQLPEGRRTPRQRQIHAANRASLG